MSTDLTNTDQPAAEICEHELTRLRKDWWCFLVLGILLAVAGTAAISYPFLTSVGVVVFMGAILIFSGVAVIISAFWAGKWSAFMVQILIGLLYIVAGFAITEAPAESVVILTLMLAGFFIVAGGFRIISALVDRYPQWGWALLNGIITVMLGLIIFRAFKQFPQEPGKIFWIIGLLVGLELIFNGWTWIMLSIAIKRLPVPQENVS
jgi:uncharacterized membrane protein HdeD (DUF308 family)